LRKIKKISWVDEVTNAEVLQRVRENRSILDTVQHQHRWIRHVLIRKTIGLKPLEEEKHLQIMAVEEKTFTNHD